MTKDPATMLAAIEQVRKLRECHRQAGILMQELEYTLAFERQCILVGVDRKVEKITQYVTEEFIPRTGAPKYAAFRHLVLARKSWDQSPGKYVIGVKLEDGREVLFQEAVLIFRKPKPLMEEKVAA